MVEVKPVHEDLLGSAVREQVGRYWTRYRLVLATNLREFAPVGEDAAGEEAALETFRLAGSDAAFERKLQTPRAFAREAGTGLVEYLGRALSHRAALAEPRDLAWLLASYARDGLARVEAAGDAPSLTAVRTALEEALGVRFKGEKGARFFHSTLVQTLFYGIFSAWVLWARADAASGEGPSAAGGHGTRGFSWREAVWHLRAPVLQALFQHLHQPGRLQPLGLVEVLDWTAAALDRVDRDAFFSRFNEGEAVPYFYEPFLEAFDPALRKQHDPIIAEVWTVRDDHAARFDYDVAAIFKDIREKQEVSGRDYVRFPARAPSLPRWSGWCDEPCQSTVLVPVDTRPGVAPARNGIRLHTPRCASLIPPSPVFSAMPERVEARPTARLVDALEAP